MIVLLSYPGDQLSNSVIDWLHYYKCCYKRINLEEEDFRKLSLTISESETTMQLKLTDGSFLKVNEVSIFLFRGGLLKANFKDYKRSDLPPESVRMHLLYEFNSLTGFFYRQIKKKCLGDPLNHPLNKLQQLECAKEAGLRIPLTIIHDSKKQLVKNDLLGSTQFITKSIQENALYQQEEKYHYDMKVNEILPDELPDCFFPSLFQESIKKSVEVRSFYLDGRFYSIAMLLCGSEDKVIDYRTKTTEIRYAKYQLPKELEEKLRCFMKNMELTTGSIDLIRSQNGEHYFLEVNPHGQIAWVSEFGEYCLEEKIARYLLKKEILFNHERTQLLTS